MQKIEDNMCYDTETLVPSTAKNRSLSACTVLSRMTVRLAGPAGPDVEADDIIAEQSERAAHLPIAAGLDVATQVHVAALPHRQENIVLIEQCREIHELVADPGDKVPRPGCQVEFQECLAQVQLDIAAYVPASRTRWRVGCRRRRCRAA